MEGICIRVSRMFEVFQKQARLHESAGGKCDDYLLMIWEEALLQMSKLQWMYLN